MEISEQTCPSLARLVDTGRDDPKSYVDVVGRVIHQESWIKTEKKVNPSAGEGLNERPRMNQSQIHGNQRGSGRSGIQSKKPNNQDKSSGSGGKHQTGGKRKNKSGN